MVEVNGMNFKSVSVNELNKALDFIRAAGYRIVNTKVMFEDQKVIINVVKETA